MKLSSKTTAYALGSLPTLALERVIYEPRELVKPLPSALQPIDKGEPVPPHAGGFSLQVLDLTHIWSDSDSDAIDELDDIHALAAAVCVVVELNLSPEQRYPQAARTACWSCRATCQAAA